MRSNAAWLRALALGVLLLTETPATSQVITEEGASILIFVLLVGGAWFLAKR